MHIQQPTRKILHTCTLYTIGNDHCISVNQGTVRKLYSLFNTAVFPHLQDVCSHGSFVKDDMKIDDLSLGGLEVGELKLEKPVKESLCQQTESKDSGYKYTCNYVLVNS